LVIHGGTTTVSGIAAKLCDLGVKFKPAENEVRARLSELRRLQMVHEEWRGGQVWALSELGGQRVADITPQLFDEELELFSVQQMKRQVEEVRSFA
jgi:hypothetical protein